MTNAARLRDDRQSGMLLPGDRAPTPEELRAAATWKPAPITVQELRRRREAHDDPDVDLAIKPPVRRHRVSITLPWSTLHTGNSIYAIKSKEYQAAKGRAREAIAEQIAGYSPIDIPVRVECTIIEPNRHRGRDILNYQKLIADAMSGLVYQDDKLIDDAHFMRGEPDVDRPRVEITVTPVPGAGLP